MVDGIIQEKFKKRIDKCYKNNGLNTLDTWAGKMLEELQQDLINEIKKMKKYNQFTARQTIILIGDKE